MRYKCLYLLLLKIVVTSLLLEQFQCSNQQLLQKSETSGPKTTNTNNALANGNNITPLIQAALAVAPKAVPTIEAATGVVQSPSPLKPSPSGVIGDTQSALVTPSYGNEDPIIYLDYSSINDEILRKRTANFVYFNANFNHCRHCHKFFDIWKELAVDIRWWRQIIKFFTINCSDEDNIEMCRRAGVTQFPQVKYYWVMSNSLNQDGQRLRILGKSVHAMRHLIMDKVLDSYVEHNKILAQRNQQKPSLSSSSSTAALGSTATNPLASMMGPLMSQMLSGTSGSGSGGGGLNSIMSMLSGKGGSSGGGGGGGGGSSMSGLMGSLAGPQGIGQLMNAFMGAGSMSQRLGIQPLANNWPELEPIEASDSEQLLNILPLDPSKSIGSLLIMETQEFLYTGLEVMLDLNPYSNQTYIARVKDDRSQLSKNLTKRDDIQAPALIYVTATRESRLIMTAPKYTNDEDLRRAFVRAFERRQIKYPVKRVWSMPPSATRSGSSSSAADSQEDEELLSKVHQVYMNDLTNALRASLMEQVFKHPDLSDDQYNALVKYVYALINYFPFNNDESLKFFKRLHSWLQNQVSPMDIGEYKKQFHDIDDVFQQREWIACKSLSNTKAIPSKSRKSSSLFENPAQLGKVVSNITRLFRGQQQQANKLKNLFNAFTTNVAPVMLGQRSTSQQQLQQQQQQQQQQPLQSSSSGGSANSSSSSGGTVAPRSSSRSNDDSAKRDDSPIERILKSLSSGSLGSDSSILKLISTALTGGSDGDSGTTGKSKFAREYPCGIWKLAHVMVVNEYIKDSPRKDVKHIVLHSLHQYMLHFYACSTCGNRVSDVSNEFRLNLDEHLQDQGDSVLLLWKVHNRINKRLESELRPGSPPKLPFPTESLCPKCRAPRTQNDLVSTPNWHDKQVLNFLVHHYRPQSLVTNANSTDSSGAAMSIKQQLEGANFCWRLTLLIISLSSWFLMLHKWQSEDHYL